MGEVIRMRFSKGDAVRYISHLDLQRIFGRALKRAKIPIAYSQGFNPHPKLSFGSALSVGTTSDSEYIDVDLAEPLKADAFISRMNQILPIGLRIEAAKTYVTGEEGKKLPTLMSVMNGAEYRISLHRVSDPGGLAVDVAEALRNISEVPEWKVTRTNGKKQREVDIKPYVYRIESPATDMEADDSAVILTAVVQTGSEANVRPTELVEVLQTYGGISDISCMIHRSKLGIYDDGVIVEPFPE